MDVILKLVKKVLFSQIQTIQAIFISWLPHGYENCPNVSSLVLVETQQKLIDSVHVIE